MQVALIQNELLFSLGEYKARVDNLRSKMQAKGVEVMLSPGPENIFYLSGYQSLGFQNYQMLIVPLDGEPTLVLRFIESMLATKYSWVKDVVIYDDTDDPVQVTINALKNRNLFNKVVACEEGSDFFHVKDWRKLHAAIPTLVDGTGLIESCRAVKSPAEVAYIREAARLTCLGMEAAINEIKPGATDNDLSAAAFNAMTRAGSEYLTDDPIITTGARSGIPHTTYMRQEIKPGDTVLLEISAVYNRYHAPLMRGATLGKADARARYMADVCIEALNAAIWAIRPGVTAGDVDQACRSIIEREGLWENFRKRTGYSIGCGFGGWGEGHIVSLRKNDPTILVPGMCFHIPPALRYYGEAGFGFSETVTVTETGVEVLTTFPRRLYEC